MRVDEFKKCTEDNKDYSMTKSNTIFKKHSTYIHNPVPLLTNKNFYQHHLCASAKKSTRQVFFQDNKMDNEEDQVSN